MTCNFVRSLVSWLMALPPTFIAVGFLGNYYSSFGGLLILALLFELIFGGTICIFIRNARQTLVSRRIDFFLMLILFCGLLLFDLNMFAMLFHFPLLFE